MNDGCANPVIGSAFAERPVNRLGPGVSGIRYLVANPKTPKQRREYFQSRGLDYIETADGRIEPARNRAERRQSGYRKPVKGMQ